MNPSNTGFAWVSSVRELLLRKRCRLFQPEPKRKDAAGNLKCEDPQHPLQIRQSNSPGNPATIFRVSAVLSGHFGVQCHSHQNNAHRHQTRATTRQEFQTDRRSGYPRTCRNQYASTRGAILNNPLLITPVLCPVLIYLTSQYQMTISLVPIAEHLNICDTDLCFPHRQIY